MKKKKIQKDKPVTVHIPGCDTCVICGEDIPEGYGMVCRKCEYKYGEPK